MIRHAKQFWLFADVEVITEILCVVLVVHLVDFCCQKLACAIGGYLVQDAYTAVRKEFSRGINRMEHERKVVESESFLIVITDAKIMNVAFQFCEENKVVGYKGEEELAAVFTNTLCFANTCLFVPILVQMVKRAKQKYYVKGFVLIAREVKGVALNKVDRIIGRKLLRNAAILASASSRAETSYPLRAK